GWPATTPTTPTTSWWALPPSTRKAQLDEKWSFVYKKEKNCDWEADPGDLSQGDQYDHAALGPDSRLVLSVLVGKRLAENADHLAAAGAGRVGGRAPELIPSEEYGPNREAIERASGGGVTPPRTGKPGRPAGPRLEMPAELNYATVNKSRQKGRVTAVTTRGGLGAAGAVGGGVGGGGVNPTYKGRGSGRRPGPGAPPERRSAWGRAGRGGE